MKCYYHEERDSVGRCTECGKELCKECVDIYNPPLCTDCAAQISKEHKYDLIKRILTSILCVIGGFFLYAIFGAELMPSVPLPVMLLLFAGLPYGWDLLDKSSSNVFVLLPGIGWLIYMAFKLALAFCIGWIVLVVEMIKIIVEIIQHKRLSAYIKSNR